MAFKTMFEFDRFILSLDQTNISINILNSIISIDAPVFTVTYIYICIQGRHEFSQPANFVLASLGTSTLAESQKSFRGRWNSALLWM